MQVSISSWWPLPESTCEHDQSRYDRREAHDPLGYFSAHKQRHAEEAISCTRAFNYDLVILDLRLGMGMDGVAVFKAIRQTSMVPIIGLTGMNDSSTLYKEAVQAGLKIIFTKPLDRESIDFIFRTPGAIRAQERTNEPTEH